MQRSDELAAALAAEIARNMYYVSAATNIDNRLPRVGSFASASNANAPMDVSKDKATNPSISHSSEKHQQPLNHRIEEEIEKDGAKSNNVDDDGDGDDDESRENDTDTDRRVARCRERNREHARRTRKRKKAQLEALQEKVKNLQLENKSLKQSLEECSIASILVGLSFITDDGDNLDATIQSLIKEATEIERKNIFKTILGGSGGGKRKRFVSDASDSDASTNVSTYFASSSNNGSLCLKLEINGKTASFGGDGRSLNWKNGIYTNETGVRSQLTKQQLESLRRERNRIHAKMTRDRKKSFIATIMTTIKELESSNHRMRAVLKDVIQTNNICATSTLMMTLNTSTTKKNDVTPCASPTVSSVRASATSTLVSAPPTTLELTKSKNISASPTLSNASSLIKASLLNSRSASFLPPKKRIRHGFALQF